ncbi:MAG TPA: regulatory protein RecX [Steroidobacteraceae bacterium]|jgi:regulatory protein
MRRAKREEVPTEEAGDLLKTRAAAVKLLARRDFASTELKQKLQAQGFDATVVDEAVEELIAGGILNDARFAEHLVTQHADRGQGPLRITALLKELRLPDEVIDAALAAGPDWLARAREVRIRRFGLREPATWPEKAKQGRFLQYRGFSSDHIRAALGPDVDLNE